MLDQNLTIILSTLLGGLLSIAGGFAANYYTNHFTSKTKKQEEKRNNLITIYKTIMNISYIYTSFLVIVENNLEPDINALNLVNEGHNLNLLVSLNAPSLRQNLNEFDYLVGKLRNIIIEYKKGQRNVTQELDDLGKPLNDTASIFLRSVINLLEQI